MPDSENEHKKGTETRPRKLELSLLAAFLVFAAALLMTALLGRDDGEGLSYSVPETSVTAAEENRSGKVTKASTTRKKTETTKRVTTVKTKTAKTAAPAPEMTETVYPVDINLAVYEDLVGVSGIGDSTASAILAYREQAGVIHSMEQLLEVSGIGEKTLAVLCEYFYVSDADKLHEAEEAAVVCGTEPADEQPDAAEPTEPEPPQMTDVNINTATAEEIAKALLLTDKQAQAIVELREKIQYFSAIEELLYTEVITAADIERIRGHVLL
ncbi:Helix-hairpin-helix motif-containing protein [Ruminococcus sp. YE71]|uniref:ComEA family DNA-binding protein n=1 Tax=unclassified Ruminococcus TaxID=2608920 RepID=UPI0008860667|nr:MULTISPECIES: helix-hairpin-helix domain-containing protein [unclassified Ruminococcus]SDA18588.1 Helix-hairpin-helix motif-containing protein [Ruminococcus sp. YE78]SFW29632.1 Helix-hairpin-helix motif-containing protein [Ruminococcus sp. YE71]